MRILVGLVFLLFGIAKLFPIEAFELLLVDQSFIGWKAAPYFARAIVFWEILLGVAIIFNYESKKVLKLILLTLILFTLYLLYDLITFGNREDCGCTGELISLNTWYSILKNVVLIMLTSWLLIKGKVHTFKKPDLVGLSIVGSSFAIILFFAPFYSGYAASESVNKEIDLDMLPALYTNGENLDYKNNNSIIAFVSPKCIYCKRALQRIKVIQNHNEILPVYLVFFGTEEKVIPFMEENNFNFPFILYPDRDFFRITGGQMPMIFHVDNGVLKQIWSSAMFDPEDLIQL